MIDNNKTCETCGWSEPLSPTDEHNIAPNCLRVLCNWGTHNSLPLAFIWHTSFMYTYEGVCCPCWKEKPEGVT